MYATRSCLVPQVSIGLGWEYRKAADGITNDEQFLAESACPISAAGSGHHQRMQGWFSQIIIGIIVTVVGTVIANSIVRGPGGRHFMSGVHFSGPTRR